MLFELKLLRRTLFARRRGLVRFTALAAVLGIAAGVSSLTVAQAVAAGFQSELRNAILAGSPHITVFRADGGPISDASDLQQKLSAVAGIVSVDAAAVHGGVIRGPVGNGYAVVTVEGGATVDIETTYEADIGVELAAATGLNAGSKAELFLAQKDGELFKLSISVSSLTRTGLFDRDSTTVKLKPLADTAKTGASPNQLELRVADVFGSSRVAAQVSAIAGEGFRVVDWQEANRPLFSALRLERRAASLVILLIVFIAVLNVTTTLSLLVAERRLDIAVLRTCGAKGRTLLSIFIVEGVVLGIVGALIGAVVGAALCFASNRFGLLSLDPQVYSISNIPLSPGLAEIAMPAAAALILCLVAAVYPAFKAASIKPLENLRNQ